MPNETILPGIFDISEDAYHSDPCDEPSLSSSLAKLLLSKSPAHARLAHPKLNPDRKEINNKMFNLGKAAHKMILGKGSEFEIIPFSDFKTKVAQEARDQAYSSGKIPLRQEDFEQVKAMAASCWAQLKHHEEAPNAFMGGKAEQTLIWKEDSIWCRSRLDWLPSLGNVFYDFKTTGQSAAPDDVQRVFFNLGYDIQAAFYSRGIRKLLGIIEPVFRFVIQETEPPYALSVVQISPGDMAVADRKVVNAIKWWEWCLKNNKWPGYPSRVAHINAPIWHEQKWFDREDREEIMKESGENPFEILLNWQAPLVNKGKTDVDNI